MANMANFKLPSESGVRHLPRPSGPFCVGWVDVFTAGRGEVTVEVARGGPGLEEDHLGKRSGVG